MIVHLPNTQSAELRQLQDQWYPPPDGGGSELGAGEKAGMGLDWGRVTL